ncbi:MAG: hypothetical protein LBF37_03470 [Rickettsiales bacterium]|jgi:hypothetical protein|nr:hypothetical protein [Rickettsiales bacterium]
MKKSLFLLLALLVAGCSGTSESDSPTIEMYQCGDYTIYLDPYIEKTYDLSGGLLTKEDMEPVELNSSDIVKWPMIVDGDGKTEIWSKTLKTADSNIIFQMMRYEAEDKTLGTEAIFSEKGIFRNGMQHIDCEFIGTK